MKEDHSETFQDLFQDPTYESILEVVPSSPTAITDLFRPEKFPLCLGEIFPGSRFEGFEFHYFFVIALLISSSLRS